MTEGQPALTVLTAGYGLNVLAFLCVAFAASLGRMRPPQRLMLVLACLTTAGATALQIVLPLDSLNRALVLALDLPRSLLWSGFLIATIGGWRSLTQQLGPGRSWATVVITVLAVLLLALLDSRESALESLLLYIDLVITVIGLLLIENLFRNAGAMTAPQARPLCMGLAVIFTYDFMAYADILLSHSFDHGVLTLRGFVEIGAIPFLMTALWRLRQSRGELRISHQMVYHSAVLLGGGVYLLVMALTGFVLRQEQGVWGGGLQLLFLLLGGAIFVMVFATPVFRARLRVMLSKHFFQYRYDYREVWLKVIDRLAQHDDVDDLHRRIVVLFAELLECREAALWVLRPEDDAFFPAVGWHHDSRLPVEARRSPLTTYFEKTGWVINVPEYRINPAPYEELELPQWLQEHPKVWLIVPLLHHKTLHGFLLLAHPDGPAQFSWEEIDLLKTIGAHVAGLLAEELVSRALLEARRLEEFNRHFAFVVHDIKNIVGQMSLLTDNAARFGHDPEFQQDMIETVANAVGRMRHLLAQLSAERQRVAARRERINLTVMLTELASARRKAGQSIAWAPGPKVEAVGRADALRTALTHLIDNAFDAAGPGGTVRLDLLGTPKEALIAVIDSGPGMSENFIRETLFQPLASTKDKGMGVGAYQARALIRDIGGRLEVDSEPGQGTIMRVILPMAGDVSHGG